MGTGGRAPLSLAVSRGMSVLRTLGREAGPVRFSDFRRTLPGLSDSSLSRILRGLEEAGYLVRHGERGYGPGPELEQWQCELAARPLSAVEQDERAVRELVRRTNESAGAAFLESGRLVVTASRTADGAVSIIGPGSTLHFEADHAASLAVLEILPERERLRLLEGPYSRIGGRERYVRGRERLRREGSVVMDQSLERPGISRVALAAASGDRRGTLYLCLTEKQARERLAELAGILEEVRGMWTGVPAVAR